MSHYEINFAKEQQEKYGADSVLVFEKEHSPLYLRRDLVQTALKIYPNAVVYSINDWIDSIG